MGLFKARLFFLEKYSRLNDHINRLFNSFEKKSPTVKIVILQSIKPKNSWEYTKSETGI